MFPKTCVRWVLSVLEKTSPKTLTCQCAKFGTDSTPVVECVDAKKSENPSHVHLKRSRVILPKTLTLIDEKVAKSGRQKRNTCAAILLPVNIAELVKKVSERDVPFLELHSGPGLLTKALFNIGVREIFTFEPRIHYKQNLQIILAKYAACNNYFNKNLYSLFYEGDKIITPESANAKYIFPFTSSRNWKDAPSFNIVGAHCDFKFWLWMLLNISQITWYHSMGRPQIIMAFPEKDVVAMLSGVSIRRKGRHLASSLFPEFFEWEALASIPRDAFMPLKRKHIFKDVTAPDLGDGEKLMLCRVSPACNLFDVIDCTGMKELRYFIDQHFNAISKKQYVVSTLEKYIPGCGRNIVLNGFDVSQKFQELSSKEIWNLFLCFRGQREYKSSAFYISMKDSGVRYLNKQERKRASIN